LGVCNLHEAITKLKEEINGGVRTHQEPVVEEYMPLVKTNSEGSETLNKGKERSNMKNWMNSVRLWNVESKPVNSYFRNDYIGHVFMLIIDYHMTYN